MTDFPVAPLNGRTRCSVTIVQDYLCARAGSERVAAVMTRGIEGATLIAALYSPENTYPVFRTMGVRTLPINRLRVLRNNHRRALPVLAPAFHRLFVDADVCLCSTTGWSHGVRTNGRKVVYWHSPAKWLHQRDRYAAAGSILGRASLAVLRRWLIRWDEQAVRTIDRHLCNSTYVAKELMRIYGVSAEVLPPPHGTSSDGPQSPVPHLEPGFLLSVNRLLPYKNVEAVVRAIVELKGERLVLVGKGPLGAHLKEIAGAALVILQDVDDSTLRWLYANCAGLVTAAREDFGLTPLEAASFGKPAAVLRAGGFRDTVVEAETGVFFDTPHREDIIAALGLLRTTTWHAETIKAHAARFGEEPFLERLNAIIAEECRKGSRQC